MEATFKHFDLGLIEPDFNSDFMNVILELNHLRRQRLYGSTKPWLFFQLKEIFHLLESVGSARIEGNRTTVSEYIEQKIEKSETPSERFTEISNVEKAMTFIDENMSKGADITTHFIRELHRITVNDLDKEGDKTPGNYRSWGVKIAQSSHIPPDPITVKNYMDELLNFINTDHGKQYDLIKVALAHHRFAWVHPFGNGNGRVVRLMTYVLLIKYGFKVSEEQLLNPTAVFCNNRDTYYKMLSIADQGDKPSLLTWCEYVLTGIRDEIIKVNKLLDHDYLFNKILKPSVLLANERGLIDKSELEVLKMGLQLQEFKASDVSKALPDLTDRQRTHLIQKLRINQMIEPLKENGRTYGVVFYNNYLMRSLITFLEKEGFIPEYYENNS